MQSLIQAGIDAGGTLIKAALRSKENLQFKTFPVEKMDDCASWLNRVYPEATICLTGGGASRFSSILGHSRAKIIPEFAASCRGASFLLQKQCTEVPEAYVLANVGTGTSIHIVRGTENRRIGGSGVGGGTIIGLSRLLTGTERFDSMMLLAEKGDRRHADLTVAHIYGNETPPIPGDLTASNFGLVPESFSGRQRITDADKLAAVIGLVAETVTTLSIMAASEAGLDTVVFIGSSFVGNPIMKESVIQYSRFRGANPIIPDNGQYSGALGAILVREESPV